MALVVTCAEEVSHDLFKLLIATMMLNKTTGKAAIPVFREILELWPTPQKMSNGATVLYISIASHSD